MAVNDGVVVVLVDDDSCKVFIFTADALCDIVLTVVDPGDIIVLTADVPGDFIVLIAGADSCVGGSGDEQGIGEAPIDTFNLPSSSVVGGRGELTRLLPPCINDLFAGVLIVTSWNPELLLERDLC